MTRIPISVTGLATLTHELQVLEREVRPDVIQELADAAAQGDLIENTAYLSVKERQAHIEGKILELKTTIGNAEVIDCSKVPSTKVMFGTVVELLDLDTDETLSYCLLGKYDSDVKSGSISVFSPLGRSFLGKEVGDEVVSLTPGGDREFEILSITASETP